MRYFRPIKSESRMKIPALLLVVIAGCCANENLDGASFVFYKDSKTSKVVLKPTIPEPLSNITVCLESYTDIIHVDSFFKLQSESNYYPPIHIFQIRDIYYFSLDKERVSFKVEKEKTEWRLICASWESSTGIIHFVVNGKLFPRRVLKPGFIIEPKVTAVLGQHLASVGLTFSSEANYVGEFRNINVWDQALNPDEMQSMFSNKCSNCNGNVINWKSVDYEIHGEVVLYRPSMKP